MFRKIAFMFVLIVLVSLVACGGAAEAPPPTLVEVTPLPPATNPPPTTEPPTTEPTPEPTPTVDSQADLLWRDVTTETIGGTSRWTNKVELADINGDGWVDLLFANGGNYDAPEPPVLSYIFLNHGPDQPYEEVSDAVLGPDGMLARVIKVRDVDNDSLPDIMVGTTFQTQSRLYLGQGDGVFTEVTATHLPQMVASIGDLEFGDVDDDGDLDMVLADWGPGSPMANEGGRTLLWLNDGEGRFTDVTADQMPDVLVKFSWELEFVDIDNDYDLDILVSCKQCTGSFMFENDGTGTFTNVSESRLPQFRNNYDFEAIDINSDSFLDLVTINDGSRLGDRVFINNQQGIYIDATKDIWPSDSNPPIDDNMIVFLDYDSDGDADILIGSLGKTIYIGDRMVVNEGERGLSLLLVREIFPGQTAGTLGIAVADLNSDNRIDIVEAQGEVAWPEKVYYGQNNPPDTAPPIITLASASGQPPTVCARIHDNKSPTMPHDWQSVVVRQTTGDGQIIETPMQWYGEYLWRATLDDASADTMFEVCAVDKAGNEACAPPQ